MRKKNKPHTNKQTSNKEIKELIEKNSAVSTPEKEPAGDTLNNHNNGENKKRITERGLFYVNIGMLFAFIIVNYILITNSEENTQIEMRAYLQVKEVFIEEFRTGKPIMVVVHLLNVGKTPAYNLVGYAGGKSGGSGMYESDWETIQKMEMNYSIGSGLDNFIESFSDRVVIDVADSIWFMTNRKSMWVFGEITYDDVFGENHFTRFCYYFSPPRFKIHTQYNEQN